MKKICFFLFLSFCSIVLLAQKDSLRFTGNWLGTLDAGVAKLRIGLSIADSAGKLTANLMSPDQGVMHIAVNSVGVSGDTLFVKSKEISASYQGVLNVSGDSISGNWKQGSKLPLKLGRVDELPGMNRPQEPKRPFPYIEEDVTFHNDKAGIDLSGTLTLPFTGENFTAVVLVSGSGPQNRDEELLGHKPFLVISDFLTRNGIAVLRYDDRGAGKSKGVFSTATTTDFATDAEAALMFLKKDKRINHNKIGIIGHSEGGMIAPMVASANSGVAFVVMLAGPGLRGEEILLLQSELIARADSTPKNEIKRNTELNKKIYNIAKKEKDDKKAADKMRALVEDYWKGLSPEDIKKLGMDKRTLIQSIYQVITPWFRHFLVSDPKTYLTKVTCPVLAVNGSKDLQVPAKENLAAIDKYLKKAGNKNYTIKEFEGLNHLFQHCSTGSPSEYLEIEETFSPDALEFILQWIKNQ